MSSLTISMIILACVFGGALPGLVLRAILPQHHLTAETKDIVKLGMGLVGTMAALVLGLLVASAKGNYDAQSAELTQSAANIALLDRVLAMYGAETKESRAILRGAVARALDELFSRKDGHQAAPTRAGGEILYEKIQGLKPTNDAQRSLQSPALSLAVDVGKTRWLMYEQGTSSVSLPLLIIVVVWLTVIFVSFGLFAPVNATVITSLFVAALSVSGAHFLILEMYTPSRDMFASPTRRYALRLRILDVSPLRR